MKRLIHLITLLFLVCPFFQVKADIRTDIETLSRALFELNRQYVDSVDVDSLTEIALKAMLKQLDPHTNYLTPKELSQMREGLDGGFEGIGVTFRMVHDTIVVMHPVEGGPSAKAGIQPGDMIITCGDSILAGRHLSNDDIKNSLRGPGGSIARLGILRDGSNKLIEVKVKRDKIPVFSAQTYYMASETVGYIHIERFSLTTAHEVESAIEELTAQGMQDLIIDLQGNGGGYLNAAVELASIFLPAYKLVVYTEGRSDNRRQYKTDIFTSRFNGHLVVLLDEQSASASEIFAGCIQDYDRGVIVGRRSFGKGLVQRPIELPNGGLIRLTVSHYYTPSGRCIQKPYVKGQQKDYNEDILNRLNHGELLSADSIHLDKSLQYQTTSGRTVYGGGGILPDCFVPLDTTRMEPAHRLVNRKTSMLDYTMDYFRHNHAAIHMRFPTLDDFIDEESGFDLTDEMVQGVIDQARRDSVTHEGLDSLLHNTMFRMQILAYLANNLYDNGAYKRIINRTSNVYLTALDILADDRRYIQYLQPK